MEWKGNFDAHGPSGDSMKVGDVVNFNTKSWVFNSANDRYTHPGIIIEQLAEHLSEVYWRDGKITREHSSYLVKVTSVTNR
jgi:hypothetical protein